MAERRSGARVGEEPRALPSEAAAIGCGVIGAAWVARLRLRGVPVRAYDPSPAAEALIGDVARNAAAAWEGLGLPVEPLGPLRICGSVAEAVDGVELVQESVPEVLELKQETLSEIDRYAPAGAVIASSTSGLRCSAMAEPLARPDRLLVAHPFNPVYLLPLVEVVGGERTSDQTIDRAMAIYRGLGMKPLHIRVEIDAHVADRLLEAVWRESLWLVHDGVATTEQIDDAIRYGFGLRGAQRGVFETYRIAGGEGGFGHFLEQFGPALRWPWTKLTDTPELTDELIGRLETQSDEQSGAYSIRELEQLRDRNLVAILRSLEELDWGAGQAVAALRRAVGPA